MVRDLSIWFAWIAGSAVAIGLVAGIWWSLFADRSRGRRRCPACWHDMTGTSGLRCPECGHDAGHERHLFATRRRWMMAAGFLLALLVATVAFRIRVTQEGIASFAPTRLLLWSLPYASATAGPPDDVQRELQARLVVTEVDPDFLASLAEQIVAGDSSAKPCDEAWANRYGRLAMAIHERARNALSADDPAVLAAERFRSLPAFSTLVAGRATAAPAEPGAKLVVDLTMHEWWPSPTVGEVTVRDTSDGSSVRLFLDGGAQARAVPLLFRGVGEGEAKRTFEIEERHRATRLDGSELPNSEWSTPTTQRVEIDLTKVPVAPGLEPRRDAALDQAVLETFAEGVLRWESGPHPVAFRFDPTRTGSEQFAGVLVGVEITLRERGEVRRRLEAWWPAGPQGGGLRFGLVEEDLAALSRFRGGDGTVAEGWTVTVRGDPAIAARAFVPSLPDATARPTNTAYWAGELTFPAKIKEMTGAGPRRRWRLATPTSPPAR